jgi:hypothetical protein
MAAATNGKPWTVSSSGFHRAVFGPMVAELQQLEDLGDLERVTEMAKPRCWSAGLV